MERDAAFIAAQMVGSRRQQDQTSRERLAENAYRKKCAKHKGRNHWRNWERRMMAAEKKRKADETAEIKKAKRRAFLDQARAFWLGRRDSYPKDAR